MATTTPEVNTGWQAPDFCLPGTDQAMHTLGELAGSRATVIGFICNHCPYVKAILPRLIADARDLSLLGVKLIAINANDDSAYPQDSFTNMIRLASDWPFPYLHDATQQVARSYGAVCTPDFFGFDADLKLQYRGRIDGTGKQGSAGEDSGGELPRELFEAMTQVARSGTAPQKQICSVGCSIKWRDTD